MGIRYRLWQTWQYLTAAPLDDAAWQEIESRLTTTELILYHRYRASERRHAYRVMCALQKAGYEHPALLTAALLHDIGKTRLHLHVWERALVVAFAKLLPGRVERWGIGKPAGWRRTFVVKTQHPAWGAEMAANAGSDVLAVELIRRHQDPLPSNPAGEIDQLLHWLQWADDRH